MSDLRLRELERRYLETGEATDEAEFLREAIRTGHLEERKLGIAADLGYRPARLVLDRPDLELAELADMGRLIRERWGQWELVRLNLVLARRLLPPLKGFATAQRLALEPGLAAIKAWLAQPSYETSRAVRLGSNQISPLDLAAWVGEERERAIRGAFMGVIRSPIRGLTRHPSFDTAGLAVDALGLEGYLEALSADLIPELLRAE